MFPSQVKYLSNNSPDYDGWMDCIFFTKLTSLSRIFHSHGDVPIAGKGMQRGWTLLGAHVHWAGRGLYCAAPAVTRSPGVCGLIHLVASYDKYGVSWGHILSRIITGAQILITSFLKECVVSDWSMRISVWMIKYTHVHMLEYNEQYNYFANIHHCILCSRKYVHVLVHSCVYACFFTYCWMFFIHSETTPVVDEVPL